MTPWYTLGMALVQKTIRYFDSQIARAKGLRTFVATNVIRPRRSPAEIDESALWREIVEEGLDSLEAKKKKKEIQG